MRASAAAPARAGRWKRRLLVALAIGLPLALVAVELGLRYVLFAAPPASALAQRLRRAELYAADPSPEHWKLVTRFDPKPRAGRPHPLFDAELGWRSAEIDPVTRAHAHEARLGARRPVLLYGDSFAQCVERAESCWQELLDASELGARFGLLNHGVGGYGLDQMYLLYQETIERFADRDPVVVVGILVDDDLDRCALALRNHVKPRFVLRAGELVLEPVTETDARSHVAAHPVGIASYALRLLIGPVPSESERADRAAATAELCTALLAAWKADLERRGLEHFFVLFHGRGALSSGAPHGWQEPLLHATFERLGIPFVSSRPRLTADADATGRSIDDYYFTDAPGLNHLDDEGNRVVFEAFRQGLLGAFDGYALPAER
jgi:hypothetical protein